MVRALYCVVWCSKGRLENRDQKKKKKNKKRTNKKTQWLINVFPQHPTDPLFPLSPCMAEHNWSKSKLNYIHSSIYKNIPSTLLRVLQQNNTEKQIFKKAKIPRGAFIPIFLCFYINIINIIITTSGRSLLVVCHAV